jgi:hypothetical protein
MTPDEWFGPTTEEGVLEELLTEARRRALGLPTHEPSPDDDIRELGMVAGIPRIGPWAYSNADLANAIKAQLDRMGAKPGMTGLT